MATKGQPLSEETKAKLSAAKRGKPQSAEHVAKRRAALPRLGFSHEALALDAGGRAYDAVHQWMNRNHPRVGRCEWCGTTGRATHYANAGHRYTRNRADWFEFCVPCHKAFDERVGPSRGHSQSPAARAKLSAALAGNKNGVGNAGSKGRAVSAETRKKLSASIRASWVMRRS